MSSQLIIGSIIHLLCRENFCKTRMHSSRMRSARSSGRPGGSPPGTPPDQALPRTRHPPGADLPPEPGTLPGADPPQPGTPSDQAHPPKADPPDQATPRSRPPPVNRITDACKTLPCPNFVAGGNNRNSLKKE